MASNSLWLLFGQMLIILYLMTECCSLHDNASAALKFQGGRSLKFIKRFLHSGGEQPYAVTYHHVLQTIIDLNIYWGRRNALFLVDNQTNPDDHRMEHYLRISLTGWELEIKKVDSHRKWLHFMGIHRNLVVMCSVHLIDEIIKESVNAGLFGTQHTWIIVSPTIPDILMSTTISSSTQITILKPQDQGRWDEVLLSTSAVDILDVFYSVDTQRVEWVQFASWKATGRLSMLETLQGQDSFQRLRGREIRIAGFTHVPYVSVAVHNDSIQVSGYSVDVLQMILKYFKVEYTTKEVKDHFGTFINGTYTGLIGNLFRKEADISLNILFMMPSRLEVTKFLAPVTKLDLAMAYRPPASIVPPTTYLLPFSGEVWLVVFSFIIGMTIFRIIIIWLDPKRSSVAQMPSTEGNSAAFRILTGTYFKEAFGDPKGVTSRTLYATLVMACTVISIFYTSVFTSFLAYRELKMPIRNLRELISSHDYNAITVRNTKYEDVFRRAQGGLFAELWQKMKKNEAQYIQNSIFQATLRMYEGHNVFLGDGASIIAAMQNNCTISLMRTPYFHEYGHIVTRTDFPFARMFSFKMLQLREGGLLRRLGRIYMTDSRPPCPVEDISLTFGLEQVQGVFLIMVGGIILSLMALVIEILVQKLMNCS